MKHISRHLAVAFAIALIAGLGVAAVAFGQTGSTTDPTSGYTDSYTTTTPDVTPTPQPDQPAPVHKPEKHGTKPEHASSLPVSTPATRPAPSHLAFTGADPIAIAAIGVVLMLAGYGLHRRRRRLGSAQPRI